MRLAGVHGDTVYGISGTTIVSGRIDEGVATDVADSQPVVPTVFDTFSEVGRIPSPDDPRLIRRLSTGRFRSLVRPFVGDVTTASVFRVSVSDWIVTVGPRLYSSHDAGETWTHRLDLPPSSGPMGVLPSAFCRTDERVYLGEYPLGTEVPRVLASSDGGRSWETACRLPRARHVHAVQVDPFTGDIWVTTGDADSECAIGRLRNGPGTDGEPTFERVGGGDQTWRAVELAFTPTAVLWGMDCGYASRNRLYRLDRDALDADGNATPVTVGATDNSVYYAATVESGGEYWVAFATAVETGRDRTAPDRETAGTNTARVVVASSESDYNDWYDVVRFERRTRIADAIPGVPSANAYVYLASHSGNGLLVNPFNTDTANGRVLVVSPTRLASLTDGRSG